MNLEILNSYFYLTILDFSFCLLSTLLLHITTFITLAVDSSTTPKIRTFSDYRDLCYNNFRYFFAQC